jgi:hypothetical protein
MKITKTQLRQIVKEEILNEVNSSKQLQELFGIGDKIANSSFGKKAAKLGRTAQAKTNRALGQGGETELTYVGDNHKAYQDAFEKMRRFAMKGNPFGDEQASVESELDHYAGAFKRPVKTDEGDKFIISVDESFHDYLDDLMGNAADGSFEYKFLDGLAAWVSQLESLADEKKGSEGIRVGQFADKSGYGGPSGLMKIAKALDDKGEKISS